jgi:cellulose synthase/poly-beta-1,6-N-acetylglucosamine synthase-like glycosyltransferase
MDVKSLPKVSVVMTSYNEVPEYLFSAIESYLSQQGVSVQLILSILEDDRNTNTIIEKYKNQLELVVVPKTEHPGRSPLGSFFQLNYALNKIKGDWFSFASSNDYASPTKFLQEIYYCLIFKKKVCYSSYDYLFYQNRFFRRKSIKRAQLIHEYDFEKHKTINYVSDCALLTMKIGNKYFPFNLSYIN